MKNIRLRFWNSIVAVLFATNVLAFDVEVNGIYYDYGNNEGELTIVSGTSEYSGAVTIPSEVTIGTKVYNVTEIGKNAFNRCGDLTKVELPYSIKSIGISAFGYCGQLKEIEIPKSCSSIEYDAFHHSGIEKITVSKDNPILDSREKCNAIITTSTNELIIGCNTTFIPSSVKSIGHHAFYCCENLSNLEIPNGVVSIGNYAFYGCSSLHDLVIPASVTEIAQNILYRCDVSSIVVQDGNVVYDSRNNCNAVIKGSELILGCKNTVIPVGVTSIGNSAFYFCEGLSSLEFPDGIVSIGQEAFHGCSNLVKVHFPDNDLSLGGNAFANCSSMQAFHFQRNVSFTGSYVFLQCANLVDISIGGTSPQWFDTNVFEQSQYSSITISVLEGNIDTYKNSSWNRFTTIQEYQGIIITVDDCAREYGKENPVFGFTIVGGALDKTPRITCVATPTSPIGTYEIVIDKSIKEYNITLKNGTLTVLKAPLTVDAGYYTKNLYEENPPFKPILIGFRNGENESVMLSMPVCTTDAETESYPGNYDVIASGGDAPNYYMLYAKGRLVIKEAEIAKQISVNVMEPGTFYSLIDKNIYQWISNLKVVGDINADDLYHLQGMSGSWVKYSDNAYNFHLHQLDLSEATFVDKGKNESTYHPVYIWENNLFKTCKQLQTIVIPRNTQSIGSGAFCMSGVETICVPEDNPYLTAVDNIVYSKDLSVIYRSAPMKSGEITIPNTVKEIGAGCFEACQSIESVIIPSNVETFGKSSFIEMSACKSIYCLSETPPYIKSGSQVFGETAQNAILYVPKGRIGDYRSDNAWKIFKYIAEFEGASGIEGQQVNSFLKADVYSLNGTLIAKGVTTIEKLPKGIYIINKKKYIKL